MRLLLIIISVIISILLGLVIELVTERNMVFMDYSVQSYIPPKSPQPFPKIIHQTWKTKTLNDQQKAWQKSVKDIYPDYTYILWDDNDLNSFVKTHFPWYYNTWNTLTPFIKKVDTVRYMWMYAIGGIYIDLDVIAYKSMEPLFLDKPGSAFIPTMHSKANWSYDTDGASPAILASYPGNPIWLMMLEQVRKNRDREVLKATGPVSLANLLREIYIDQKDGKKTPNLTFLSESRLGLGLGWFPKYSNHKNAGTWVI